MFHNFTGHTLLRTSMAVETLGRRQNTRSNVGHGRGRLHRSREKSEKENSAQLLMGKSKVPQLVGVQILPLRIAGLS